MNQQFYDRHNGQTCNVITVQSLLADSDSSQNGNVTPTAAVASIYSYLIPRADQNIGGNGGASTVKEQGHFEVRKSSSQVTRSQGHNRDFLWGALFS